MSLIPRLTIKNPVEISGVGLFTSNPTTIMISPADSVNDGIVFKYLSHCVPATIVTLSNQPVHPIFAQLKPRCTSVGDSQCTVATVEHILSAFVGLGITDAIIELRSNSTQNHSTIEIPILDGSSLPFVQAIHSVGSTEIGSTIDPIVIHKSICVQDGNSTITIEPAQQTNYSYTLDYSAYESFPYPPTTVEWNGNQDQYVNEIAPARTFCMKEEADAMHNAGLFTHLGPKDMLVIDHDGPIDNSLRIKNECAYHKLLDLIGDLALVGRPIQAKIHGVKSGHALAHQAALAILKQST